MSSNMYNGQEDREPLKDTILNSVIVDNSETGQQAIAPFLGQSTQAPLNPGKKQMQILDNFFS